MPAEKELGLKHNEAQAMIEIKHERDQLAAPTLGEPAVSLPAVANELQEAVVRPRYIRPQRLWDNMPDFKGDL